MTPETNMRVPLRELPTTREIELSAAFIEQITKGMPMRMALEAPINDPDAGHADAHIELYGDDDANVFVRGRLRGWLAVACSRCIGLVRVPVEEDLAVTFVPAGKLLADDEPTYDEDAQADDDDGVELGVDNLDLYGYEGEVVDLEPLLREQIVLSVPLAPLCSESCKGLCPQCGVDRNHETCSCEPPIDPRLASLRDINLS